MHILITLGQRRLVILVKKFWKDIFNNNVSFLERPTFLQAKDEHKPCEAPGSYYFIMIQPDFVEVCVNLPGDILALDVESSRALENKIHDVLEQVLAPYFKGL